ncbi:MAG: hypothetical protein HOD03_05605 [Planctomycetes bacterium]|nr:hypothetical protein [Planctomycetota bacterium]
MQHEQNLSLYKVFRLWFPLAASWLLMGAEGPTFSWFVASMPEQKTNLAAFGGVAFPISLAIEGPIIMLLAASTALCKDMISFLKVRKFMLAAAGGLTAFHILIAFTPIYYWVAESVLGVPADVVEPGRVGLQILTPWTAAIAYRRFLQGVLIRFGQSRMVMYGTAVRLITLLAALNIAAAFGELSGIAVGTIAISSGVIAEAIFARWAVGDILRNRMPHRADSADPINRASFLAFYLPLAVTPLMTLCIQPAGAAGMSRMFDANNSLAAWTVVHALVFLARSTGFAFNEVVVAQTGRPHSREILNRFCFLLAIGTSSFMALIALTPLSDIILDRVFRLERELATVCKIGLLIGVMMPAYQAYQSLYQGRLVAAKRTKGIIEAVAIYVVLSLIGLMIGAYYSTMTGMYWAMLIFVGAGICQTVWLGIRAAQLPKTEASFQA